MNTYGTVYRVENDDTGNGPYHSTSTGKYNWIVYDRVHRKSYQKNHPIPWMDVGFNPRGEEVCGFSSIKQLKKWFCKTDLDFILRHNFSVLKYENVVIEGTSSRQVIFSRKGRRVKITNITKSFL
jgi:hypothetical protein